MFEFGGGKPASATTLLGRTELEVARAGLGSGGHSRLGLANGKSEKEALALINQALALGVNFIDTAPLYGTEHIVGEAIKKKRDKVVLSTKVFPYRDGEVITPGDLHHSLQSSLNELKTDYIDIVHLHGVTPDAYEQCRDSLLPALETAQREGKVRFIGVSEYFQKDPAHRMLQYAIQDDCWDTIMVGHNILNQSAHDTVLPRAQENNVGVIGMFAVRRALADHTMIGDIVADMIARGLYYSKKVDTKKPLAFLTKGGKGRAKTLAEAAYRFVSHEEGIDMVLTGTGNRDHLKANLAAIYGAPLKAEHLERVRELFSGINYLTGE